MKLYMWNLHSILSLSYQLFILLETLNAIASVSAIADSCQSHPAVSRCRSCHHLQLRYSAHHPVSLLNRGWPHLEALGLPYPVIGQRTHARGYPVVVMCQDGPYHDGQQTRIHAALRTPPPNVAMLQHSLRHPQSSRDIARTPSTQK